MLKLKTFSSFFLFCFLFGKKMSKAWARLQWNCIVGSALCVCLFACLNVNTVSCLCPGLNGKDRDRDKKKGYSGALFPSPRPMQLLFSSVLFPKTAGSSSLSLSP
jgi:hypothetical protein